MTIKTKCICDRCQEKIKVEPPFEIKITMPLTLNTHFVHFCSGDCFKDYFMHSWKEFDNVQETLLKGNTENERCDN